jgi:hypothetical protein
VATIKDPRTISFTASTNGRTGAVRVRYLLIITDYSPSATMTVHLVREVNLPERTAEEHKAWAYSKVRPVAAQVVTSSAMDWEPTKDGTPLETVIKTLMVSVQEDAGALILKADGVLNV